MHLSVSYHYPYSLHTQSLTKLFSLPEMLGGWGNPLMRNETEFMILDGTYVLTPSSSLPCPY